MARPTSFSGQDLAWECSQVKRKLLNDTRKGRMSSISKSNVFEMIALRPKIGLKSARMLWGGKHRDYLDSWYSKLEEEFHQILKLSTGKDEMPTSESLIVDNAGLQEKVNHLAHLVATYRQALDILRSENAKFRDLVINRFGRIDDF